MRLPASPVGEVDALASLHVAERRGLGRLGEGGAVAVVDAQEQRVVGHDGKHDALAEQAGAAEHAAQGEMAERRQLFAQEGGEAFAGGGHGASCRP